MRLHALLARFALPLVIVLSSSAGRAQEPEFSRLPNPQRTETPGKIEVIEFFWYGCLHCNRLEPMVEAWEKKLPKDVVLRREHVVWPGRKETELHARLFLALRAMKLLEAQHRAVFDAIHKANGGLRTESQIFEWAARRGIDKTRFEATFKSFNVQAQLSGASIRTRDYQVVGVPTFIVNGKYSAGLGSAEGEARLFAILDELIAKERAGQ